MLFVGILIGIFSYGADAQAKALTDVLAKLQATEAAVNKLWATSRSLDLNATKLEHDTARAMDNETNISTKLLQLEFTTRDNNRTLGKLAYETTEQQAQLDFDKYDLKTSDKAKKDTTKAAKTLATKANNTVTPETLAKLEEIGAKLWRVSDPTSKASLDKTEARLKGMDVEVKYVREKLAPVIEESMKKKMRRNLDGWKKDNMDLGLTALRNSGELSKYFLTEDKSPDADPDAPQWPLDHDGTDINGDEWFLQVLASKSIENTENAFGIDQSAKPPPSFLGPFFPAQASLIESVMDK